MATHDADELGYRPGVGIMLLSRQGKIFLGHRIGMPVTPAWQMPQGGIDTGETPRRPAKKAPAPAAPRVTTRPCRSRRASRLGSEPVVAISPSFATRRSISGN